MLTPEQLAEIRRVVDALGVVPAETIRALLAEVKRLRDEMETMADSVTEAEIDATAAESERDGLRDRITTLAAEIEQEAAEYNMARHARIDTLIETTGNWSNKDHAVNLLGTGVKARENIADRLRKALADSGAAPC